jgi:hypothetical protein
MFKINLVPEIIELKQKVKKVNRVATISAISLLAVLGVITMIIGGIDMAKKSELTNIKAKISATEQDASQYKELEDNVLSLEKGLAGAREIIDGSNSWSKLLPHLEKATPQGIKYTQLDITSGQIVGSLRGAAVESLAKYVASYQGYKVLYLSGPGQKDQTVSISVDGGTAEILNVKTSGRWSYAAGVDPSTDHQFVITSLDGTKATIQYIASTKEVQSTDPNVSAEARVLFTSVSTNEYRKIDEGIAFDVIIAFDPEVLW